MVSINLYMSIKRVNNDNEASIRNKKNIPIMFVKHVILVSIIFLSNRKSLINYEYYRKLLNIINL
jgi:hypothetical protein